MTLTLLTLLAILFVVLATVRGVNTLSANIQVQTGCTATQPNTPFADTVCSPTINRANSFTSGVGAGQANQMWQGVFSLAASASVTKTLTDSSLKDPNNVGVALARVKCILVELLSPTQDTTNGTLCSGVKFSGLNGADGFVNGTSPFLYVYNGGFIAACTPSAAGVASALALVFTNLDGAVAAYVRVTLWGGLT